MSYGLPGGWDARVDPNSGRQYYVDNNSNQTHWELPRHHHHEGYQSAPIPSYGPPSYDLAASHDPYGAYNNGGFNAGFQSQGVGYGVQGTTGLSYDTYQNNGFQQTSTARDAFGDRVTQSSDIYGDVSRTQTNAFGAQSSYSQDAYGDYSSSKRDAFGDQSTYSQDRFGDVTSTQRDAFGDSSSYSRDAYGDTTTTSRDAFGDSNVDTRDAYGDNVDVKTNFLGMKTITDTNAYGQQVTQREFGGMDFVTTNNNNW